MNERIEELSLQCIRYKLIAEGARSDFDYKKFAELIVKDCIKELLDWKKEPFPFDEHTAVWILKKHFGVEE